MIKGGAPFIASFAVLIFLPLLAAAFLDTEQFAIWTILNTVATVAITLDFGGVALVTQSIGSGSERGLRTIAVGCLLSASGSLAIGVLAMAAWTPFRSAAGITAWSQMEGIVAIAAVTLASSLRSMSLVLAGAAVALRRYRLNSAIVVGQSVVVVLTIAIIFIVAPSPWALPIGWTIGPALVIVLGLRTIAVEMRKDPPKDAAEPASESMERKQLREFASLRTLATILSAILLQADRWVLGAIGGPAFLAVYELVWRLASGPRLIAQSINVPILPEVSNAGPSARSATIMRSGLSLTVKLILPLAALGLLVAIIGIIVTETSLIFVAVAVAIFFALASNAVTSPVTNAGIGVGRPGIDLRYLGPAVGMSILAWAIGWSIGNVYFASVAGSIAFGGVSILFVVLQARSFEENWSDADKGQMNALKV
jgi:O-antigen/teichoic acid export membrane protein